MPIEAGCCQAGFEALGWQGWGIEGKLWRMTALQRGGSWSSDREHRVPGGGNTTSVKWHQKELFNTRIKYCLLWSTILDLEFLQTPQIHLKSLIMDLIFSLWFIHNLTFPQWFIETYFKTWHSICLFLSFRLEKNLHEMRVVEIVRNSTFRLLILCWEPRLHQRQLGCCSKSHGVRHHPPAW